MADRPLDGDTGPAVTPRWVKVFGTVAIVVLVLFVLLHLTGEGPRLHMGHGVLETEIE